MRVVAPTDRVTRGGRAPPVTGGLDGRGGPRHRRGRCRGGGDRGVGGDGVGSLYLYRSSRGLGHLRRGSVVVVVTSTASSPSTTTARYVVAGLLVLLFGHFLNLTTFRATILEPNLETKPINN